MEPTPNPNITLEEQLDFIVKEYKPDDSLGVFKLVIKALINQEKIKEWEDIKSYGSYNADTKYWNEPFIVVPLKDADDRITQLQEGGN